MSPTRTADISKRACWTRTTRGGTRDRNALVALMAVLWLFSVGLACAQLKQVEPGVYVADFTGGTAAVVGDGTGMLKKRDDAQTAKSLKTLEVTTDGKFPALSLAGEFQNCVFFETPPLKDFVLETTLAKTSGNFAGVVVRDDYMVYFQQRGYLCLGLRTQGGMLFKSDKQFGGQRKLKVVCAGGTLRAYVDGEEVITWQIEDKAGKCGVYAHKAEVKYREFRVSEKVDAMSYVSVTPVAENDELVFAPGKEFALGFKIANASGKAQTVAVKMAVMDWQDKALAKEQAQTVTVEKETTVAFPLPGLPKGFYRVMASAKCGTETVFSTDGLPLAIQERGRARFVRPDLVVSAYSKYSSSTLPVDLNTYTHATARILAEMGFNAIVYDPTFTKRVIEIYGSYGIATITRAGAFIDSPFVIASLESDEPKFDEIPKLKERYAELKKAGKQVTTNMIGESMGLGGPRDPLTLWRMMGYELRAFRWYGIKKGYYGLLHGSTYKGWPSLSTVMRVCDGAVAGDWWFIPPSFGDVRPDAYYKNPTPAEMKGLMHMAMAHGAKGLMLWTLHDPYRWPGLIGKKSLAPTDGKLAAATEAGTLISKHGALLKSLGYGGFALRDSDWIRMEAVPRKSPEGQTYIYLVNKDKDAPATAKIAYPAAAKHTAKDLFSGKESSTAAAEGGFQELEVTLAPGDGALLAVQASGSTETPAAPTVKPLGEDVVSQVAAKVAAEGVALMTLKMPAVPCALGDAIGFWRQDDPRLAWQKNARGPNLFSWSGGLWPRSERGYVSLDSALLYAGSEQVGAEAPLEANLAGEANPPPPEEAQLPKANQPQGKNPLWTLFPAVSETRICPEELRAMLHLGLAFGSRAVLVTDAAAPALIKVVEEVAASTVQGRKLLPALKVGGADSACFDPHVALVPLHDGKEGRFIYAINLSLEETVNAELLLLAQNWTWAGAKDVDAGRELTVGASKQAGYLGCSLSLSPGEGRLIAINAQPIEKQRKKALPAQVGNQPPPAQGKKK